MTIQKLGDILSSAGVHLTDFKIHCSSGNNPPPLQEFLNGNFKQYQERQNKRNFQCKQILSLIHLEKDQWLFAGVYDVFGYRQVKEPKKMYYYYETSEVKGLNHLTGKAIVTFNKNFRASYLKGQKYFDQLIVSEICQSTIASQIGKRAMLVELYAKIKACRKCSKNHFRTVQTKSGKERKTGLKKVGYGKNPDKAKIVIIGQNPGWSNQDEENIHEANPFEIRRFSKNNWRQCKHNCGKNLGRALQKTGIDFDLIYITNAVQCTTEQDNYPDFEQLTNCGEWLFEELEIINPKVVICLGKPACERMGVSKGKKIKKDNYTLFGLDHPSYMKLNFDDFQEGIEEAVSLVQ